MLFFRIILNNTNNSIIYMTISFLTLSKAYFLKWTKKYEYNPVLFKLLIIGSGIIIFLTWYISVFLLLITYSGMIITRKRFVKRIKGFISRQSIIPKVILIAFCTIIIFFIVIMIFTVFILAFMFLGNYIENRKYKWKVKDNKSNIVFSDSKEKENQEVYNKVNLPLKRG